jgi:hypothetical protein
LCFTVNKHSQLIYSFILPKSNFLFDRYLEKKETEAQQ